MSKSHSQRDSSATGDAGRLLHAQSGYGRRRVVEVHLVRALLRRHSFSGEGLTCFVFISLLTSKPNEGRSYALAKELVGDAVGIPDISGARVALSRLATALETVRSGYMDFVPAKDGPAPGSKPAGTNIAARQQ